MSLTIFIDRRKQSVSVLRWFLNSTEAIDCAHGPLVTFGFEEFRKKGLRFIREHFALHKEKRLSPGETSLVLETPKEKRFLKNQIAIKISEYPMGVLIITPLEFKKFSLSGLKPLPEVTETRVALNAKPPEFWRAFDKAFEATQ